VEGFICPPVKTLASIASGRVLGEELETLAIELLALLLELVLGGVGDVVLLDVLFLGVALGDDLTCVPT